MFSYVYILTCFIKFILTGRYQIASWNIRGQFTAAAITLEGTCPLIRSTGLLGAWAGHSPSSQAATAAWPPAQGLSAASAILSGHTPTSCKSDNNPSTSKCYTSMKIVHVLISSIFLIFQRWLEYSPAPLQLLSSVNTLSYTHWKGCHNIKKNISAS